MKLWKWLYTLGGMEQILQKDIFNEKDLFKLSPDYTPAIPLRMEMRRNLVKDTHSSAAGGGDNIFKTGSWQRKSIRKTKDCYKSNKEIVKIRNHFHNLDLKNKIMLKYVDSIKPKTLTHNDKLLIKGNDSEIKDEENFYLKEITENMNNLAITCDSEFKVNDKPKPNRVNHIRNRNKDEPRHHANIFTEKEDNDIDLMNYGLKIECHYVNESVKVELNEEMDDYNIDKHEENETELNICPSENNFLGNDLNSLLILMALTPKSNSDEDPGSDINEYKTIQTKQKEFIEEKDELIMPHSNRSKMSDNMSNYLCVAPLRIKISNREETILRKYVEKWKSYVSYKKEEFMQQRKAALDNFFDKIAKKKLQINEGSETMKKAKLLAQDFNIYQRRYKVQKHIIALQRAKLEEQNRVIEELKYNKILEASRESVDIMREQIRRNYYDLDRQLKPKIKVLTNELKLHNIEEPSLVLHCLKVPQFLQRMEKRAREREEKHAMIRERRRQMEEERIRLKQQAELAKAEMDKEEKMKRLKELKDKRKREKIETIRKKQYAARLRALIVMADLHYEKTLVAKYGIRPFKILLDIKRDNVEKAKAHYVFQLKKNVFLNWMWYTEDMWFERNFKADECRRKNLLRKGIVGFIQNARQYVLQKQVADDYYDFYVTQLVFKKFREGLDFYKKEQEMKWNRAIAYHNSNILFKTFVCWRTLPALNALKRQQDARKARWREKVLQVVPDYTPPED